MVNSNTVNSNFALKSKYFVLNLLFMVSLKHQRITQSINVVVQMSTKFESKHC